MGQELYSVQCITRTKYNIAGLSGSYQVINGTGFSDDIKIFKIYNGGTVDVDISYDGVTDHDIAPGVSTFILDCQANHADNSAYGAGTKYFRNGQLVYAKNIEGGPGGTGFIYLIGYR
jgi:hypothetical protein